MKKGELANPGFTNSIRATEQKQLATCETASATRDAVITRHRRKLVTVWKKCARLAGPRQVDSGDCEFA